MSFNDILMLVMAAFALIGGLDRLIGNRFGLGKKFEEGILTIGPLSMSMIGMICLAPILADVLGRIAIPLLGILGADPAMLAGSLLANDMGGAALAESLAADPDAGRFAGYIVSSMMGVTVVFTIPTALYLSDPADREELSLGILCGVITVPLGCLAGGFAGGFSARLVLINTLPVLIFALLLALGLWKIRPIMLKGFAIFGKIVGGIITVGLVLGILRSLTGWTLLPDMTPIEEGFSTVAGIAIVLAGAFPLVELLTRLLRRPMLWLGKRLGINEQAVTGLIASLANSIPTFSLLKEMDPRGKVVNMAFAVSAAFVFGDHLGFTAGIRPEMVLPMIVGKLAGGLSAAVLALFLCKKYDT